ncbi:hypothetical protein PVAG01_03973 [Phlyctema vagabunda]|uniref:Uncharacterized protein n=1 Tax=Phlyctema vagabunda TaxID=108571 RepID=A0ABR4PMX6_9HELO
MIDFDSPSLPYLPYLNHTRSHPPSPKIPRLSAQDPKRRCMFCF